MIVQSDGNEIHGFNFKTKRKDPIFLFVLTLVAAASPLHPAGTRYRLKVFGLLLKKRKTASGGGARTPRALPLKKIKKEREGATPRANQILGSGSKW